MDAEEALAAGLVDEVVGADGRGPVTVAMDRLRQFFAGRGALVEAMSDRAAYLAAREQPLPFNDALLADPRLAPTLAQARNSGRGSAVDRILQAIAEGAAEGQQAGLALEAQLFAEAVCDPAAGPPGIRAFLERRSAALPIKYTEVPPYPDDDMLAELVDEGRLLPPGASFFAGVTPVPEYQYGMGVSRRSRKRRASPRRPGRRGAAAGVQNTQPGPGRGAGLRAGLGGELQ